MKKFMYMCMMLLAATLTFTACGSDDDDDNGGGNQQQNQSQNEVNQDNYYKYQESVNVQGAGTMTVIGEATFENGKCTAIAFTYVYPTKSIAKQIWDSYQNDPDMAKELPYYSYDGDKTMSYRFDEETVASLSTLGKDYVCKVVKSTVQSTVEALGRVK